MFDAGRTYWITPVAEEGRRHPIEVVRRLVVDQHIFAIGEVANRRNHLQPGDRICFYATGSVGVVAHARIASPPSSSQDDDITFNRTFPFVFGLADVRHYIDELVAIDANLRGRLDGFVGRDPSGAWAWFVRGLHTVTKKDFGLLTRTSAG